MLLQKSFKSQVFRDIPKVGKHKRVFSYRTSYSLRNPCQVGFANVGWEASYCIKYGNLLKFEVVKSIA